MSMSYFTHFVGLLRQMVTGITGLGFKLIILDVICQSSPWSCQLFAPGCHSFNRFPSIREAERPISFMPCTLSARGTVIRSDAAVISYQISPVPTLRNECYIKENWNPADIKRNIFPFPLNYWRVFFFLACCF